MKRNISRKNIENIRLEYVKILFTICSLKLKIIQIKNILLH